MPTPSAQRIADAQSRLARLGHDPAGDPPGTLGERTRIALQAFQRQRGLPITGELDATTFDRIVEAGWALGDRLLFLSRPLMRGDDVAALQESLALLGFDPGRIDGIFGALTRSAIEEFQRNCDLEVNGVASRATLEELGRLSTRSPGRQTVTEAREEAGNRERARLVALFGAGAVVERLARDLAGSLGVVVAEGDEHAAAVRANAAGAGLFLAVLEASGPATTLHYFESYRSHSVAGRGLAEAVARELIRRGEVVAVTGMSVPLLRETMMTALLVTPGAGSSPDRLVEAVTAATMEFFDTSR